MVNLEGFDFQPICPAHYQCMIANSRLMELPTVSETWDGSDIYHCHCSVNGCPQEYSPGYGYFTVGRNDDHWNVTGSSSLQIIRRSTQAICGEHQTAMFLASFDPKSQVENFRCPQRSCPHTISIIAGSPPAYWLDEDYFKMS